MSICGVKSKKTHQSVSVASINSKPNLKCLYKRYQSQELELFTNIDRNQIFSKVLNFTHYLISNPNNLQQLIAELKFEKNQGEQEFTSQKSQQSGTESFARSQEGSMTQNSSISSSAMSGKENKQPNQNSLEKEIAYKRLNAKCKISIMGMEQLISEGDISSGLISAESIQNLSSKNLPKVKLSLLKIEDIYQMPEPFLINLSICLLLKFLYYSKLQLTSENVCWMLAVGTIVAYKIYYDEPVGGLVDSFAHILEVSRQEMIDLQICFLNIIEHRAIIDSYQYHLVLCQIVAIQQ